MFTDKDLEQIKNNDLTLEKVNAQIDVIKYGMSYSNLVEAAKPGKGILKLSKEQEGYYINLYESKQDSLSIVKFVPASGAATRMFKFLFKFLKTYDIKKESINSYINKHKDNNLKVFIVGIEKLPFYDEVIEKVKQIIPNFDKLSYDEKRVEFIKTMLFEDRLNYGFYPKGLFPFHNYKDYISTAFEEHLFEAPLYASSKNIANLHFTISEKHKHKFDEKFKVIEEKAERQTDTKFNISFSYQNKSTDTIAITAEDTLFRQKDESLLFRPSGHGALIENLNTLDYELIFIKNIDNVVVSKLNKEVSNYKKMLGGVLLEVQEKAFKFLHQLEKGFLTNDERNEIEQFLSEKMNVVIASEFKKYRLEYQIEYLREKLNRPIRVCGMVKNEGEPGGGPFWVKCENGNISLQIIEFAQIDMKNGKQKAIASGATHFNPTDMVCGVKNYKGEKFDLTKYVDPKAAFITMKTQNGTDIKALELPGLWNGTMSDWNSIFVEIPLITFNPVKTVNDLLKVPHQVL